MSTMRQAIDNLRYRWLDIRIGGPDATLRGQWVVVSLSLVLVFACFFAIGRFRAGGGASSPAAAPSALAGASGRAAIPAGLSGGSPIAGAVPVAIAVKPRRPTVQPESSAELQTSTSAQSFSAETARSESPESEAQSSSEPAPEPAPTPVPTRVSTPPQGGGGSASSGNRAAKGGSRPSGGGSFDSSE
jgi:hypothetical protein